MKSNHELDDRKMKILQTIIKTYLETGDPVGSRTISKYTDLNLSSATIAMRWRIWKIWDTSCSLTHRQVVFHQTKDIGCM